MSLCSECNDNLNLLNINHSCSHVSTCEKKICECAYYNTYSSLTVKIKYVFIFSCCHICHLKVKSFIYISSTLFLLKIRLTQVKSISTECAEIDKCVLI